MGESPFDKWPYQLKYDYTFEDWLDQTSRKFYETEDADWLLAIKNFYGYVAKKKLFLNKQSTMNLFTFCLVMAHKFNHDEFYNNKVYADVLSSVLPPSTKYTVTKI